MDKLPLQRRNDIQRQTTIHIHTKGQFREGLEEAGVPWENPCKHMENMQTPLGKAMPAPGNEPWTFLLERYSASHCAAHGLFYSLIIYLWFFGGVVSGTWCIWGHEGKAGHPVAYKSSEPHWIEESHSPENKTSLLCCICLVDICKGLRKQHATLICLFPE